MSSLSSLHLCLLSYPDLYDSGHFAVKTHDTFNAKLCRIPSIIRLEYIVGYIPIGVIYPKKALFFPKDERLLTCTSAVLTYNRATLITPSNGIGIYLMADSLFDNRYRYNYIYPRGRSGETLRAVDTQNDGRKVVIKRPAPNDAPPIRAGQEVSIVNEGKALKRLSGHPNLTLLLGEGNYNVGGMLHQYIVMERAEGVIIGDVVIELSAQGERLPQLEMLIIIDHLLDLLHSAHAKDIVYNDVDAKHLFWNRESYSLKVIDWGNAIFLEGDVITPQGISRQTDISQVGELLYFIITGGHRAEIPRDASESFRLDFGQDDRLIHSRIKEIISKAVHPNTRLRYQTIQDLRQDLAQYREPIEQKRNGTVTSVVEKLKRDDLTKNELRTLRTLLEPALDEDPGHPRTREAYDVIVNRIRDLSIESDLDAAKIYMTSANWKGAYTLLKEIEDKAGSQTIGLVRWLQDTSQLLDQSNVHTPSHAIVDAINMMFDGQASQAVVVLLTAHANSELERTLHWQIAERVSSHIPEVMVLRPNLYRLDNALMQLSADGYDVREAQGLLHDVEQALDSIGSSASNLATLRDGYREVVERLSALNPVLQTTAAKHQLEYESLPLNSVDRALNAAMALADNMHVIGKQGAMSPRDAMNSLESSRTIDPSNRVWDDLNAFLNTLYNHLQTCQTYVPAADGSDLSIWLADTHTLLEPFVARLFDEVLANMVNQLGQTSDYWLIYRQSVITGNRVEANRSLRLAETSMQTLSPALATWFSQLASVLDGADYIERHSIPNGIGRALADGWRAFDRGQLSEAERLGIRAYEIARSEAEQFAAARLQEVSQYAREWVERNGVASISRTQEVLTAVERLMTDEESDTLADFTEQMPSIETYLKAMTKGLVAVYHERSTAALRLIFLQYLMLGTLDAHEERLQDATFWREAATKSLETWGERHVATRTLDEFVQRRYDLREASEQFATINGRQVLPHLDELRMTLENNPQVRVLEGGIRSIRDLQACLSDWSDGDFRAAGLHLDNALKGISEVEQAAGFTLTGMRAWFMELMQAVAELAVRFRDARAIMEQKPDEPVTEVRDTHHFMVAVTERLLGTEYSATVKQWRDTYDQFLTAYTSPERRNKRLERMNELFRAMFIDRHPAYGLFRHWYSVLEASPEFPAPPTDDPTPRIRADVAVPDEEYQGSRYKKSDDDDRPSAPRQGLPRGLILGFVGILVAGGALLAVLSFSNESTPIEIAVTISATPDTVASGDNDDDGIAVAQNQPTTEADTPIPIANVDGATPENFETPTPISTVDPIEGGAITNTPTDIPPTATATHTFTPSPTVPTNTPTITFTPSPTNTPLPATETPLPEQGIQGTEDLLDLFNRINTVPFNPESFFAIDNGWRMGTSTATDNDILTIRVPSELLETYYGNNASTRIRMVEADLTLRVINPDVVNEEDVFFGMLLESVDDGNNLGVQIEVAGDTAINVLQISNNETSFVSQRSVNAVIVRLRMERDLTTGNISIFINDTIIGTPISFLDPVAPIVPALFVKDGGVLIGVTNWNVTLR